MDSILSAAQPPQPSSKDTGSEFAEFGIFLTVGSLPTTSAGQIARGVKIFDCRHRESVEPEGRMIAIAGSNKAELVAGVQVRKIFARSETRQTRAWVCREQPACNKSRPHASVRAR